MRGRIVLLARAGWAGFAGSRTRSKWCSRRARPAAAAAPEPSPAGVRMGRGGLPLAEGAGSPGGCSPDTVDAVRTAETCGSGAGSRSPALLAVQRALLAQRDLAEAAVAHELGPLLAEERCGPELLETLQVYFDAGENMREAARRLTLANPDRRLLARADRGAAERVRSPTPGIEQLAVTPAGPPPPAGQWVKYSTTLMVSQLAWRFREPRGRRPPAGPARRPAAILRPARDPGRGSSEAGEPSGVPRAQRGRDDLAGAGAGIHIVIATQRRDSARARPLRWPAARIHEATLPYGTSQNLYATAPRASTRPPPRRAPPSPRHGDPAQARDMGRVPS